MEENKLELHAIFYGNVQGIGFRYTVTDLARELGVVGTVKNLPNGNVEMCAQGPKAKLEKLCAEIQSEFKDNIQSMDVSYAPIKSALTGFHIMR
jgi:acylphosphatase